MTREKIISQIEKWSEFSILLAIFIPSLKEGYLNAISKPGPFNGSEVISYGGTILFLFINYIILQFTSEKMPIKWLKAINYLYLALVICFVSLIMQYSSPESEQSGYLFWLSLVSGLLLILIPATIFFIYVLVYTFVVKLRE